MNDSTRIDVRPLQPFDLSGMCRVCLRTGDSGRDATTLYRTPTCWPTSTDDLGQCPSFSWGV